MTPTTTPRTDAVRCTNWEAGFYDMQDHARILETELTQSEASAAAMRAYIQKLQTAPWWYIENGGAFTDATKLLEDSSAGSAILLRLQQAEARVKSLEDAGRFFLDSLTNRDFHEACEEFHKVLEGTAKPQPTVPLSTVLSDIGQGFVTFDAATKKGENIKAQP